MIGLRERHWLSTDVQFYYADNELFIYFGHDIAQGLKLYLDYSFSCKSYLSPYCITDLLSCVLLLHCEDGLCGYLMKCYLCWCCRQDCHHFLMISQTALHTASSWPGRLQSSRNNAVKDPCLIKEAGAPLHLLFGDFLLGQEVAFLPKRHRSWL